MIPKEGTKALVNIRPNFKKFYALTATTVKNNVMSLYTMCNIVKPLKAFIALDGMINTATAFLSISK